MTTAIAVRDRSVAGYLLEEPFAFRFFQAVWLLERMNPEAAPIGMFAEPRSEAVRIGSFASLAFPASEIQALDASASPPRMTVNFMGLTGPSGVLPLVYTELVEERSRQQDHALREFLDIFNHRFLSLFYRAWKRSRFPADPSACYLYLLSLNGLGTRGLEGRQRVPDESLVFYTGLLALQPRSAAALEQLLSDYFEVPVEVEQFIGAWHSLDPEYLCRFEECGSPSEVLGEGAVAGDEMWDCQSRVRIRLGPLTAEQYKQFLPEAPGHVRLSDLTRFFCHGEMEFEVQLILKKDDVPKCVLGSDSPVELGWTTWVKTKKDFPRDAADTVLRLH